MLTVRIKAFVLLNLLLLHVGFSQVEVPNLAEKQTIIARGSIQDGRDSLNVIMSATEQSALKMTIFNESRSVKISIIFSQGEVFVSESAEEHSESRRLNESESARYLVDMLAVNPDHHFKRIDGFNTDTAALSGYSVILNFPEIEIDSAQRPIPTSIELYRINKEEPKQLIRRIEYKSFHEPHGQYLRPKELLFIDVINKRKGKMVLDSFEYNLGVPSFIFEAPELEQ